MFIIMIEMVAIFDVTSLVICHPLICFVLFAERESITSGIGYILLQ